MTAASRKTPSRVEEHKSSMVSKSSPSPESATNADLARGLASVGKKSTENGSLLVEFPLTAGVGLPTGVWVKGREVSGSLTCCAAKVLT